MEKLNYFLRITIRNLFTSRKFVLINVIGLSVGLTVSVLILLYVRYETSFDNFNPNAGKIYRIVERNKQDGHIGAATPLALSDVLKKDFPEIDQVIGLIQTPKEVKVDGERFENLKGAIVEHGFFNLFHFPLIAGNPNTVFTDPYEIVVTQKIANKLFGKADPIGKTVEYERHPFTVSGVIKDIPANSVLRFDYFLADKFRYISWPDLNKRWYEFGLYTFVTFKSNHFPTDFEQKLAGIEKQYYPDFMKNRFNYVVVPFKGSHLNSTIQNDLVETVQPLYLWILSGIAVGILIIACLNFINISIASAGKRNIETGIKKVNGASSGALVINFFVEISIIVLASLLLAFAAVYLLLPSFRTLIGKPLFVDLADPVFWAGTIGFAVLTIVLSGLYPSLVLSRPSPVKILLQHKTPARNKMTFQKGFVVLQFAVTMVLAITLLFISKQISFMQNHGTGFDKTNLITMSARSLGSFGEERMKNTKLFVQDIEKYQAQFGYGKASVTEFVPGLGFRNLFNLFPEDGKNSDEIEMLSCDIDENFCDVFGLHITRGRFFSNDFPTDKDALILNEAAWKKLGWKTLEGKQIGLFSKDNKKRVIGVINDINIRSLQYPIRPMIYQFGPHHNYPGYITLRLNPNKTEASISFIRQQWKKLFPEIPFAYESVSQKYKAAYGEEQKLAKITGIFSALAMLLSLLGLFALSALQSEKRVKEIGIRKVNGAKISEVMTMLNRDFVKWVAVAFVLAIPIGWYIMNKWLENFAYKTNLSWWIFGLAGALALGIALATVSFQSYKAATKNPVESLRYE